MILTAKKDHFILKNSSDKYTTKLVLFIQGSVELGEITFTNIFNAECKNNKSLSL